MCVCMQWHTPVGTPQNWVSHNFKKAQAGTHHTTMMHKNGPHSHAKVGISNVHQVHNKGERHHPVTVVAELPCQHVLKNLKHIHHQTNDDIDCTNTLCSIGIVVDPAAWRHATGIFYS